MAAREVAIAAALIPPLTSCGILLARHHPALAEGAALLFLANVSAIIAGAAIVFVIRGHWVPEPSRPRVLLSRLIAAAVLILLAVHLTATLDRIIRRTALQSAVRSQLERAVATIPGDHLITVTVTSQQGEIVAWAVILGPTPMSRDQVARVDDLLSGATSRTVDLRVRSIAAAETERSDHAAGARRGRTRSQILRSTDSGRVQALILDPVMASGQFWLAVGLGRCEGDLSQHLVGLVDIERFRMRLSVRIERAGGEIHFDQMAIRVREIECQRNPMVEGESNGNASLDNLSVDRLPIVERSHLEGYVGKNRVREQGDLMRLFAGAAAQERCGAERMIRRATTNDLHAQDVLVKCGGRCRVFDV